MGDTHSVSPMLTPVQHDLPRSANASGLSTENGHDRETVAPMSEDRTRIDRCPGGLASGNALGFTRSVGGMNERDA